MATIKQKLQKTCKEMLAFNYSDGGIASYNEYNQFLCDTVPQMIEYMSQEGLIWLKEELQRMYDDMPEYDKV